MPTGTELIAEERHRQIYEKGWTAEHDDMHEVSGQLSKAALCYLVTSRDPKHAACLASWPWAAEWWKPSPDPIRNLVKAGALIAAEIDRLQRATAKGGS